MPSIYDYLNSNVISPRQLQANRSNAQKSTEPTTPEGKSNSSKNAIKHGLTAAAVVIDTGHLHENPDEFEGLYRQLRNGLAPVGITEEHLVRDIASGIWRMDRLYRAETGEIRKQLHSSRRLDLIKQLERYGFSAYAQGIDSRTAKLRAGLTGIDHLIRTLGP